MSTLRSMRLVAVSIVKNEADIIEAFVRHTQAWVDHHLIFDHDSTDGTREILGALQAEGLPLTLFTDDALGNLQQARSNHLTRLAASRHGADWILPLDADEILTGPGRAALEQALNARGPDCPASLPLLNYYATPRDDAGIPNPLLRLRYCQASPSRTRKILVPRPLAMDAGVIAGKGSHALYRGNQPLADQPLPPEFLLAHLALRSPPHQVLRVVLAELQKLSRGRSHAGLDEHYRLGYQLLAADPGLFFQTVCRPAEGLRLQPIDYRGPPLRHNAASSGWERVARALLPYLEKLAISHGQMLDAAGSTGADPGPANTGIRELLPADMPEALETGSAAVFSGFEPLSGWGAQEGPVPEAFLPPFHWGFAPATRLAIHSAAPRTARLVAHALTYSRGQTIRLELNEATVLSHAFSRVNQMESIVAPLALRSGLNHLTLHYSEQLTTDHDPRLLAVLFLSLRVPAAAS